jgi:type II secretory pathway pseudopilin PulG
MSNKTQVCYSKQNGMTLISLIFVLGLLSMVGLLAAKVVPEVLEYMSAKRILISSKLAGNSQQEIRNSFDKGADIAYIKSLTSNDLVFSTGDSGIEVSFAYSKKISLFGPASLLLEFEATTAKDTPKKKKLE